MEGVGPESCAGLLAFRGCPERAHRSHRAESLHIFAESENLAGENEQGRRNLPFEAVDRLVRACNLVRLVQERNNTRSQADCAYTRMKRIITAVLGLLALIGAAIPACALDLTEPKS